MIVKAWSSSKWVYIGSWKKADMTFIEGNVLELDCKHWGEKKQNFTQYSQQSDKDLTYASLNIIKTVNATLTFLPVRYVRTVTAWI